MSTPPRPRRVRPVVPGEEHPPADSSPPTDAPPRAEDASPVETAPAARSRPPDVVVLPPGSTDEDAAASARPANESLPPGARPSWTLDLGGKDMGAALEKVRSDVGYWLQRGRYNKVRLTREGKSVLPDIPVGAIMAAEVATLAWAGPLRTALVNVAGRLLFKVELINDAQEHLSAAREHYARGDLDEASTECVRALKVDPRMPDGYLLLGTLAKVKGANDEALRHFQRARDLDPHGAVGRQAEAAGRKLDPSFGSGGPPERA